MSSALIFTAVAGSVLLCAVLAAYGFKGRVTTIGVDLGTTFSVVGVHVGGKVQIVTDKQGRNIFPSVVTYLPNGEVSVGYEAVALLSARPADTVFNSKRFLGRSLGEASVQAYAAAHPFRLAEVGPEVTPFGQVGIQLSAAATGHPALISPESVGTRVLQHLLGLTAAFLGHSQVNKAVIAVPAKFDAQQRAATGAAFKAAGLKVVRVMEEPTAAAVAYQLHKKSSVHHILVYDFGGGTLDVSILYVRLGSVEVYATDGDEALGGSDLDLCLADLLTRRVQRATAADVASSEAAAGEIEGEGEGKGKGKGEGEAERERAGADEACSAPAIRVKAEQVKKTLSSQDSAKFHCTMPQPAASSPPAPTPASPVSLTVSRQEFEEHCAPLFLRGMLPVTRLLAELGMAAREIDEIVLVGGTTRIPHVKQRLREYFGPDANINDHIDPDITVAFGAASVVD